MFSLFEAPEKWSKLTCCNSPIKFIGRLLKNIFLSPHFLSYIYIISQFIKKSKFTLSNFFDNVTNWNVCYHS